MAGADKVVLKPPPFVARAGQQKLARLCKFGVLLFALACLFFGPLRNLIVLALGSALHSQILLIPLIFAWLVYLRWERLPRDSSRSLGWSIPLFITGSAALAKPDYVLILPWNLKEEIVSQEWNGKCMVPIPDVEVL